MVLYYSTICALYPNLYTSELPSSETAFLSTDKSETEDEMYSSTTSTRKLSKREFLRDNVEKRDLETTSEGLCDYIREIFGLSRQLFNDYQVKAMKKLLIRKSHPQVLYLKQQTRIYLNLYYFRFIDTKRRVEKSILYYRKRFASVL